MNSKLLIGIVGAVIIVIVGFVALGGSKNQTQTSPTNQSVGQPTTAPNQTQSTEKTEDATVTVDSSGFSPATLTIKAGTRVIWTNKSGNAISVNSDVHPTHRLYPPLNLGQVPNEGNVTLVFDKSGTYKYHDHYNPSHTGTVVVE